MTLLNKTTLIIIKVEQANTLSKNKKAASIIRRCFFYVYKDNFYSMYREFINKKECKYINQPIKRVAHRQLYCPTTVLNAHG
jgi:hypothetical protein